MFVRDRPVAAAGASQSRSTASKSRGRVFPLSAVTDAWAASASHDEQVVVVPD
jgi:hypothetical protein